MGLCEGTEEVKDGGSSLAALPGRVTFPFVAEATAVFGSCTSCL